MNARRHGFRLKDMQNNICETRSLAAVWRACVFEHFNFEDLSVVVMGACVGARAAPLGSSSGQANSGSNKPAYHIILQH